MVREGWPEEEEGELSETDGTITAVDYGFEVDVQAGTPSPSATTRPSSFHHATVFNFGTIDRATENISVFIEGGEDQPPPPAFEELDFDNLEAGHSGVFGSGGAGTAIGTFQSGTTCAAICFIQDRTGGAPHAIAYDISRRGSGGAGWAEAGVASSSRQRHPKGGRGVSFGSLVSTTV